MTGSGQSRAAKDGRRALILVERLGVSGAGSGKEHIDENLVRVHRELGFDVDVCVVKQSPEIARPAVEALGATYIDPANAKAESIGKASMHERLLALSTRPSVRRQLANIVIAGTSGPAPTVVVASLLGSDTLAFAALAIARRTRARVVLWEHRSHYEKGRMRSPLRRWRLRYVFRSADASLVVSSPFRDLAAARLRLPRERFGVLPNPVAAGFFQVSHARSRSWLGQERRPESTDGSMVSGSEPCQSPGVDPEPALPPLAAVPALEDGGAFVFIGAQNWRRRLKRLDVLLDAFRRVREVETAARLLLVGALPDGLSGMLGSVGLDHAHVITTGRVAHENMPGLLASANAAVISSDIETFGVPAAEAVASGIAVVTTRCGGPESVIEDGVHGHVVARGDPEALAQAMLRVLRESQAGRYDPSVLSEYAWRRFSVCAFKEQWRQVHQSMEAVMSR